MVKSLQVLMAGKVYSSRAEVERRCTEIPNGGPIHSVLTGAESEFVEELWLNRPDKHAEHPNKVILRFERRYRNGKEKWSRCFWAVFNDGTATDFSFKKALDHLIEKRRKI